VAEPKSTDNGKLRKNVGEKLREAAEKRLEAGARRRLWEKGPNEKRRRATEVVEIPEFVEKVAEGSKSPPFL